MIILFIYNYVAWIVMKNGDTEGDLNLCTVIPYVIGYLLGSVGTVTTAC